MVTRTQILESTGDYWKTYQQFGYDEQRGFERTLSLTKAKMAAGGVKAGSQQWKANLGKLESDYEKNLVDIKEGTTAGILDDWVAGQKKELSYIDRSDPDDTSYNYQASASQYAKQATPWYTEGLEKRINLLEKPIDPSVGNENYDYESSRYDEYLGERKQYERGVKDITTKYNKGLSEMSTTDFLEKTFGLLEAPGKEPTAEELSSSRASASAGGRQQAASSAKPGAVNPWW